MRKIFLITAILILISLPLAFFLLNKNQTKTIQSTPTSSMAPNPLPQGAVPNNYSGDQNSDEKNRRSFLVGQLIDKLPIEETHLLLSYDFDKNLFTAAIDSQDKNTGLAQLDAILKTNGIDSKSWITNLQIVYR